MNAWQALPLLDRIHRLRYFLPPALAILVVGYQLGVTRALEATYGHFVHYSVEIAFYSLAGPVVTWLTLVWVEHRLAEKEALEKEVRARERHLASLTAASADAILGLDDAGRITSWNRGAEHLFGYSRNEVLGQLVALILPDAGQLAGRLRRDRVVQNFETEALTRDGRQVSVDLTQTLLSDRDAETVASSLILRDVTARREREAIVEEERARIARDLHDGVAQTLYFLALKADMVCQQLSADEAHPPWAADLEQIGRETRQVIRDVRRTIFALRPLGWEQGGFLPALERFVRDFAEQLGWQASFAIDAEKLAIPARLEATIFRLVQESLNNVAKHAQAGRVWIELRSTRVPARVLLTVRDDGQGFDPSATDARGLGLGQMRQRVEAVGGAFGVDSKPLAGTMITATIPV
jgi:PAS domain S-box-containing protein